MIGRCRKCGLVDIYYSTTPIGTMSYCSNCGTNQDILIFHAEAQEKPKPDRYKFRGEPILDVIMQDTLENNKTYFIVVGETVTFGCVKKTVELTEWIEDRIFMMHDDHEYIVDGIPFMVFKGLPKKYIGELIRLGNEYRDKCEAIDIRNSRILQKRKRKNMNGKAETTVIVG